MGLIGAEVMAENAGERCERMKRDALWRDGRQSQGTFTASPALLLTTTILA